MSFRKNVVTKIRDEKF